MIGRIVSDGDPTGFAIPILKNKNGELFLDTIVFRQENLGVLFSFPGLISWLIWRFPQRM